MSIGIEKIIDRYCEAKNEEKVLKKEIEELSKEIKAYLKDHNLNSDGSDKFIVTMQDKVTEKMDEEKLLEYLKTDWTSRMGSMECPYIRRKEYVDTDILEEMAYGGLVPQNVLAEMGKCIKKTTVKALTYKEKKEKKG